MLGIGVVGPLYYFFHYVFSPVDIYMASDARLTSLAYTRTVLPAMALMYYVPHFMADFAASPVTRMKWNWFWQMFPVWVMAVQYLAKWTGLSADTEQHDRIHNPVRDVPWLRATIGLMATLSAGVWIYTLRNTPVSLVEMFVPTLNAPSELIPFLRNFVQFDHIFCFSSSLIWLALLIHDLKVAGMTKASWFSIVSIGVSVTVVAGPAAAVGLGWLWRENILATRRHKGAIVETTVISATDKPFTDSNAKVANGHNKH